MKIKLINKFFRGFLIIFFIAFIVINFLLTFIMERYNQSIIEENLEIIKSNINVHIKQHFLINNISLNEKQFKNHALELGHSLKNTIPYQFELYDLHGNNIYSTLKKKPLDNNNSLLLNAKNNISSYTINKSNLTIVKFIFPLNIENKNIGIVSTIMDYSHLYNKTNDIIFYILTLTGCIFIIILIFSLILTKSITTPIVKLSDISHKIAYGNFDFNFNINSNDEIMDLSNNFFNMVDKLKENINTINADRNKLKELSNYRKHFLDTVTHELKTPLTTILGYAQIIKDNGFNEEDFFYKGMNNIINESKRLHNMVIKLLELSKDEVIHTNYDYSIVNLTPLIENICYDMNLKCKRYNTSIKFECNRPFYVFGSSDRLREVLINLIDNSIKYGKPNNEIKIKSTLNVEKICIEVIDKGIGISKPELEKIFEPFYNCNKKTSREIGSCGLGLTIVEAIVKSHNGEIHIHSILNKGTTITIELPAHKSNFLQN